MVGGHTEKLLRETCRTDRELGAQAIAHIHCVFIEVYIPDIARTADNFNDWRHAFVLIWNFATSRKLIEGQ